MLKTWLLAARPKTLFASVCPVVIGSAMAFRDRGFHAPSALAALIGAVAIQIGTNFCNDYFDFRQGADTDERKGPTRAVQAGLILPQIMLTATAITFLVAAVVSGYLVFRAGWPIVVIGIVSIGSGIWYTASRFSLAYLGLGDLFVLVFFGPVAVVGTYFVQTLTVAEDVLIAGLAPGFLSVAILVVNNLRDIVEDERAEKRTLAVRFGPNFARWEYLVCVIIAAAIPPCLWLAYDWPTIIVTSSFAVSPGFILARLLFQEQGRALNSLLGKTAAVLLLYSITFSTLCILT